MEEAEFLSDRIGIINKGQLRAVGTSSYLKSQFCNWITVELIISDSTSDIVSNFLSKIGGEETYRIAETTKLKVPAKKGIYNEILNFLEEQDKSKLKTWSIKKGTLDDVFIQIQNKY